MNVTEVKWKNLMSECLLGTEILKNSAIKDKKCLNVNPNSVMDLRHQMVKGSPIVFCMPHVETHSEALKLLRISNYNRMLKQKEGRVVEKEIERLKEALEYDRILTQKTLNGNTNRKTKPSLKAPKLVKYLAKQCKTLEFFDGVYEIDTCFGHSARMIMHTKVNQDEIPFDAKVSLKLQNHIDEFLEPVPTLAGSFVSDEVGCEEHISGMNEGKNEIMEKFFERNVKCVNKEIPELKKNDRIKDIQKIQNNANKRNISHAWMIWKAYTQKHKNRKMERKNYKFKVEAFLSKLQEREKRKVKENVKSNHEVKANSGLEKTRKNQMVNDEKSKTLKRILEEVKTSQVEAHQKLQEISKANLRIKEKPPDLKFLIRIEERRNERLKRWEEIKERKLKLEEEKKIAEKLKENERKEKEEKRRKKLEEAREKRRLEAEKKKEREAEREKWRLAENHYRKYLVRSHGLRPWSDLLKLQRVQEEQATLFFERRLTRKAFSGLMSHARKEIARKVTCATEFHERVLMKNALLQWWEFHTENLKQNQVAADWNELKITEKAFKAWLQFKQDVQLDYLNKKYVAQLNYERTLKLKYLKKMRDYPELKKLEQAQENRKRKWRQRVKEILPDYQPVETCTDLWTVLA